MTQSVRLNEHTIARLIFDGSEDPRFIDLLGDLAQGIGVYSLRLDNAELDGRFLAPVPEARIPAWVTVFRAVYERHDEKVALRAMGILRSLGAELPGYIGFEEDHSHSDSYQWNEQVFSGPTEEIARRHFFKNEAWGRGEVVAFLIERKCPVTKEWFTVEGETPVYGVYILRGETMEAVVRRAAAECFDLDAEPISDEGQRILERKHVSETIQAKRASFDRLATAANQRLLTDSAESIFAEYELLILKLQEELEER